MQPVQFHKEISLDGFLSLYGTDDQHRGHDRCCQLNHHKLQQCHRCHRQTSITAGTIFEAAKLPPTVWFQAIYLMTQDKKDISAMKLHRHLDVSCNAAWRMRHKLMQARQRDSSRAVSTAAAFGQLIMELRIGRARTGKLAPGRLPRWGRASRAAKHASG